MTRPPNRIDGYRNVIKGWREFPGKRYFLKSLWEINFAHYLAWLKTNGNILDWWYEPETFYFPGIKRGTTNYKPDFKVLETNGTFTYYEIKGWMDDQSKTKLKRMAKYHPGIRLLVIERAEYREIINKCGKLFGMEE